MQQLGIPCTSHRKTSERGVILKVPFRVLVPLFGITGVAASSSFAQSGWFDQNPQPTVNDLRAVAASDPSTVVAVGRNGTILRTTDGGATWTPQSGGTTNNLLGVACPNADTGTAVGEFGTILRTNDGGNTWSAQSSGFPNGSLVAVSFVDARTGTAVGYYNLPIFPIILRTTNGGETWMPQSGAFSGVLLGVSFVDANVGTTVGNVDTGQNVLRTTDGGATWRSQVAGASRTLNAVSFVDANTGTAVGDFGIIVRTIDGGAT